MRGRKPKPTNLRRAEGNPGKRAFNADEPVAPPGCPDCPSHLSDAARTEWYRLASTLHDMGILTRIDRAAFAAYCQAWGRWVEAEEKLAELPGMVRTPSGYVQQNPWLGVANKQLELMGRFAVELGLTPSARTRIEIPNEVEAPQVLLIERVIHRAAPAAEPQTVGQPTANDTLTG